MYEVTWIVHGSLYRVSTPVLETAETLQVMLPRWTRARLWFNPKKEALLLSK